VTFILKLLVIAIFGCRFDPDASPRLKHKFRIASVIQSLGCGVLHLVLQECVCVNSFTPTSPIRDMQVTTIGVSLTSYCDN